MATALPLSDANNNSAPGAMEMQMFRSTTNTHATVTVVTAALITFTAACSSEKGGKNGVVIDVIPTAEASTVTTPTTTVVATPMPAEITVASDVSFAAAESAYTSRKYAEAKAMFEVIVERNPANGWSRYMLALSAWKAGDRVAAESAFNSVLVIDPKHLKSHLNLARVMLEDGRLKDALTHAEKVVQLDSVSRDGYRLLGQIHGELKNLELALISYNKAIAIHPRDAWSMNNMAFLMIQNGRVEEALGPLALATSIEPRNATLQNNLGMALELTGRFTQATSAYKVALTFESGYEKASSSLARISGRVDDPKVGTIDLKVLAEDYAVRIKG